MNDLMIPLTDTVHRMDRKTKTIVCRGDLPEGMATSLLTAKTTCEKCLVLCDLEPKYWPIARLIGLTPLELLRRALEHSYGLKESTVVLEKCKSYIAGYNRAKKEGNTNDARSRPNTVSSISERAL